ncbi:MAG: di-trans,poly-cis-decaprenylcistransferase [Gammaproteobacteria bacterium]|nr:di-trans,poly-cis-decaprenylcistransferase [Gammaproteobacteria bacterium]
MSNPETVAIVMDGNRRWAKKNNLPSASGHRKGIETLINIVKTAKNNSIKRLVVYAFSTENWDRENFEVNALMNLINFGVDVKLEEIKANGIKLTFIGDINNMPEKAKKGISKCIHETKDLREFNLTIALNYGSIWDMVNAANIVADSGQELSQENFIKNTQLGKTDIDIFIRTGGDMRLSNFLLPNIGYSELFFSEKLWPEFNSEDFQEILKEFEVRQRRFGK